jgi:hypothetical protein
MLFSQFQPPARATALPPLTSTELRILRAAVAHYCGLACAACGDVSGGARRPDAPDAAATVPMLLIRLLNSGSGGLPGTS